MSYKSIHTGQQIDAGVSAALNPDNTPTAGSNALMTSGGVKSALSTFVRPNLLDNWYWVYGKAINGDYSNNGTFPINQRGQQSYTNIGYAIDRWRETYGRDGVTITQNGLLFGSYKWLAQPLEDSLGNYLVGKMVTASALFADGRLLTGSGVYNGNYTQRFAWIDPDIYLELIAENNLCCFRIVNFAESNNVTVAAAKLELGSDQTLAHQENGVWVLNEIPNYQQELAKCQRYFYRLTPPTYHGFASGVVTDASNARAIIQHPVVMRSTPTVTMIPGAFYLTYYSSSGSADAYTISASPDWVSNTTMCLTVYKSDGGMIPGAVCFYKGGTSTSIEVSADL